MDAPTVWLSSILDHSGVQNGNEETHNPSRHWEFLPLATEFEELHEASPTKFGLPQGRLRQVITSAITTHPKWPSTFVQRNMSSEADEGKIMEHV